MQSIQSRLYTNVILTAIAILLAILAFQPVFKVSTPAQAQRNTNLDRPGIGEETETSTRSGRSVGSGYGGDEKVAAATEELAKATREIAEAIREQAKAQDGIAEAVGRFTNALTSDTGN